MIVRIFKPFLLWLGIAVFGLPAPAHEFWIEPLRYQLDIGDTMEAQFVNGENFDGVNLGYFDRNSARLQTAQGDFVADLTPRNGDKPAVRVPVEANGLNVVVHETTNSRLTYASWEKFAKFAAHKDFADIEARHLARGLPRSDFVEIYTRHAKTLVGVGSAEGADRVFGMETEFVALSNPYSAAFDGTMKVRVLYQGAPRSDVQVEIFERAPDGVVSVSLTRTDAEGLAMLPTRPGHTYLLDAVTLRAAAPDSDAAWVTLWAALTFAVPMR